MHWQAAPHGEEKLVRCTRGAIWDCIVDLRADSPTRLKHFSITLSDENGTMLYIPRGFAHGFITLEDHTQVFYQMGNYFESGAARGLRFDDPAVGIQWPRAASVISERDATYPDYAGERA
jgi:dTDP-4-dehydrorhamnose 3,5-epimerase